MTAEQLTSWLSSSTTEQRLRWWCMINAHEWPPEMPVLPYDETEQTVWRWLNANTDTDERLRHWNLHYVYRSHR